MKTLFSEIIKKKVDNGALNDSDIHAFAHGLASGDVPVEQISALCMAILFNGMNAEETGVLTKELANSGSIVDWTDSNLGGPVVDKHSTGGIGDKTSFAIAPIMAACGAHVPMISGRGLGHTGGTLDKLESIPGYTVQSDINTFKRVVADVGCAIVGQTRDLAPAEGRLYAIRDITSTIESIPLISAAILAKKYAAGNSALVMDIKTGNGAFMSTLKDAESLAHSMIGGSAAINLKTVALITDMSQVLGRTAGNALEIQESIDYLKGEHCDSRLDEVTQSLCTQMLLTSELESDPQLASERVRKAISSGHAAEVFVRMVSALGGPNDLLEMTDRYLPKAAIAAPVYTEKTGFVSNVDVRAIGNMIVSLGGGRRRASDTIDHSVGLSRVAAIGESVDPATPLAILHAPDQEAFDAASAALRAAYEIGESPHVLTSPVVSTITTG